MSITRSIDVMLSRPGMYVVISNEDLFIAEVDGNGICFRCTLDDGHRRDGELRPGRWNIAHVAEIIGPFARMSHPTAPQP